MRLWHKDLVKVLPRQQLLSQWRECCAIARNIAVNGTPNHILVNKVHDYPLTHLQFYANMVAEEMKRRGYKCDFERFTKWIDVPFDSVTYDNLFCDWHNMRYLTQCYYNLQEKYDCGGITEEEWKTIIVSVVISRKVGEKCTQ